ncbi:MAG: class II aldolase/adducin family protein [Deltaproteobacteria bacterium]|nr:class II aldolase/adducin family protein [Deltaproteobacteria bacterium]
MSEPHKRLLAEVSRRMHAAGWVANHDGNASARLADGKRFLATPTAVSKRLVDAHEVLTVDVEGKVLSGRKRLFSEWHLHAAAYRARPDAGAVLHAHPPHATAVGVARKQLGVPALPEMVVSLGANVPTLDFAMPKSASQDTAIARALCEGDADALLLAGNGVLVVGVDLEQAYLRLELVEHYARILVAAAALGGPAPLPADDVKKLLEARTKAGLGRAARQ